jgi:hypothetical protein
MATKDDRNMYDIYNDYNVINSYIFLYTFWFYSHSEASVPSYDILETALLAA